MKTSVLPLLAAIAMLPTAQAAEGWYVGGSLGEARGNESMNDLNAQLSTAGANATARNLDANRSSYSIFAGVRVVENFDIEAAYVDLGDADVEFRGTAADIDSFITSVQSVKAVTANGLSMRVKGTMPVVNGVGVFGRLGIFAWKSEHTLSGSSVTRTIKDDGTAWDWALGIHYPFGEHISAQFEWGQYQLDEAVGIGSLGVSYLF